MLYESAYTHATVDMRAVVSHNTTVDVNIISSGKQNNLEPQSRQALMRRLSLTGRQKTGSSPKTLSLLRSSNPCSGAGILRDILMRLLING